MTARPPAPAAAAHAPEPAARLSLSNGLRTARIEMGSVPLVRVRLVVRAGAAHEDAEQCWLSKLTAALLGEGSRTRVGAAFAADLAAIGGRMDVEASDDVTVLDAEALAEHAPALLRLVAAVALDPALPAAEVPRLKADLIRRAAIERAQSRIAALTLFRGALYPGHPYGRVLPDDGAVERFTAEDVGAFYRANFGALRAHLYVAGPIDGGAIDDVVAEAFRPWHTGTEPLDDRPTPTRGRSLQLAHRPGSEQSTIWVGLPMPTPDHADWVTLVVTNALLGGAFTSRITSNIREAKGYAYSPHSELSARAGAVYWAEIADVETSVTGAALGEILSELERLRQEPVGTEELSGIAAYLAGTFVVRAAAPGRRLDETVFADLHGLGDGYLATFVERVHAVTPADVSRVAGTYFDPNALTIVVAGDAEAVRPQLVPFGT